VDGRLLFSDFGSRRVLAVDPNGRLEVLLDVPGQPSGLGLDADGCILVVSAHDRRLLRGRNGATEEVADLSALHNGHLGDLCIDSGGRAFISTLAPLGTRVPGTVPSLPLFSVDTATGDVVIAAEDLGVPNGMAIEADGRRLVVAETLGERLTAFELAADGTLSGRQVFADTAPRRPDGICMDRDGHAWFASPFTSEFVHVAEGGSVRDVVATPGEWAVACVLGGEDEEELWCLTAVTTVEDFRAGRARGRVSRCRLGGGAVGER
jgi:sugar lactone lactonase YvrE